MELGDASPLADPEVDASRAHQVERRDPLRYARGVVRRELDNPVAESDPAGSLARRREEDLWCRAVAVLFQEVVFHLPGVVVAEPLELGDGP